MNKSVEKKTLKKRQKFHFSGICLNQSNHFNIMLPWDRLLAANSVNFFTAVDFFFLTFCVFHCCRINVLHSTFHFDFVQCVSECPKRFENLFIDHCYRKVRVLKLLMTVHMLHIPKIQCMHTQNKCLCVQPRKKHFYLN